VAPIKLFQGVDGRIEPAQLDAPGEAGEAPPHIDLSKCHQQAEGQADDEEHQSEYLMA
jgi:hypothetical protein